MMQRDVVAIAMDLAKASEGRFPAICASAFFRDPAFHLFTPKLRVTAALGNRADVDDRLDRGFANEPREFFGSRSSMSEREQCLRLLCRGGA